MRLSNPVMTTNAFSGVRGAAAGGAMSIQGTVNKTGLLLMLLFVSSSWIWGGAAAGRPVQGWIMFGAFGGLGVALVTRFKMAWAPITGPIYAVLQGLALGGLSALFELQYPGLVIQAVALTFGTLATLLMAYTSRLIKVTEKFRLGVVAATGGIFLVYMATIILSFFGIQMPFIHDTGPLGIGISLFIVVVAALNLVLNFDFIEQGAGAGLPKFMEWYGAFGLIVTLAWLYLEILWLLAKLRGGRR